MESDDEQGHVDERTLPLAARLELLSRGDGLGSGRAGRKRKLQEKGMSRGGRHAGDEDEDEEESGGYGAPDGQETKKKKRRKGAPKEMPSNKPVSRLRTVVEPPPKPKSRDPRFDESSGGKLNYGMFRKAYGFLDDYQEQEILAIKRRLKKEKGAEAVEELTSSLKKAQQERGERRKKDRLLSVTQQAKQEERRKVAQGKQPFFLKKREVKKKELEQRYDELSKSGRLEDKMVKKRKKNVGKDLKRWMPHERKVDG